MAIEIFNRFEHKYLLDKSTYEKVIETMCKHMTPDKHSSDLNPYLIANIYYDTIDDYLIRKSLQKPVYKEKLRLRTYEIPNENSKVFVEIKKKFNGIVNKRRSFFTLKEANEFIKTKKPPKLKEYMNEKVVDEITYFLSVYNLVPKVYLAYDRIAFFEQGNPDLRISFDQNIRARRFDLSPACGDYGTKLLDDNLFLMEVKTSLAKPLWLCQLLNDYNIKRVSFSKYGTEFKQYINKENYKLVDAV